ncbi:MAG: protein kinase [Deltaproteobacteria bacterium]|jgi:serine/threonine-protein kinase|nr:protein kinase [Deltaproteobacteria bacterium]MBW2534562.1 protein kinase [Deltaproteobacteria bacterium]
MSAPDDNPLAGSSKYRVERRLGSGAMGEVYLAHHVALDKPVVIKVIVAELASSPTKVDRMRLEAQSLARLDHPNIVRVTDFDETADGRPFIVMDFLRGRTVAEEMAARGGYLPVLEALEIVRQAAAGLAGAHHAGLVHRDLKLENLFLCDPTGDASGASRTRCVKVIDFGLAKTVDREARSVSPLSVPTASGIVVGTPEFLAPEQARGMPVDHRADIYALGLVLYTLLALRGPFDDAETLPELVEAQLKRVPATPSKYASQAIPPELDALVLKCLAKEPDERPQSATELSAKLSSIITRIGVAGDVTAPRSQPRAIARLATLEEASTLPSGGTHQPMSPFAASSEGESDGRRRTTVGLGATLPMNAPSVDELERAESAAASPQRQMTTPMPEVKLEGGALAATQPMVPPEEIQVDPVPMGELLRQPAGVAPSAGASGPPPAPGAGAASQVVDPPTGASGPPPPLASPYGTPITDPPTGVSGPPPPLAGPYGAPLGAGAMTESPGRPAWLTALFAVIVLSIVGSVIALIVLFAR